MHPADFLFPRDLSVTPSGIAKVLVTGSYCARGFTRLVGRVVPGVVFDFCHFNNVARLPERSAEDLQAYAFQVVQLHCANWSAMR